MIDSNQTLLEPKIEKLRQLILNSFRVRGNQDPIYVDISGNLQRIEAPQHQIIFGRRGSGKSCLLVNYRKKSKKNGLPPIYILADEFKRLTFPDVLIRLLIELLDNVPTKGRWWKRCLFRKTPTETQVKKLRKLLDLAGEADVTEAQSATRRDVSSADVGYGPAKVTANSESSAEKSRSSKFRERKIDVLERHLKDYKQAIEESLKTWGDLHVAVLVDDFYLFPRTNQPDIIDYLHRLVRDTNLYLKVATIRHRTNLIRNSPQTVGVELGQDVEEMSLDRTLEDLQSTQGFLHEMLTSLSKRVGLDDIDQYFNPEAMQALTLVSGGVPRDFLNIFVNAIDAAKTMNRTRWLTPTTIYRGAGRLSYKQKLKNLKEDAGADVAGLERVFVDLLFFCLKESKKTIFLVSQDEAQTHHKEHELIHQLMDFKLIHVVEPDTSAAAGRSGRFEAYTLDFALFTEPRRRGIEIVKFWEMDDSYRRIGVREAPVYSLERARSIYSNSKFDVNPEKAIEDIPPEEQESLSEEAQQYAGEPNRMPASSRSHVKVRTLNLRSKVRPRQAIPQL